MGQVGGADAAGGSPAWLAAAALLELCSQLDAAFCVARLISICVFVFCPALVAVRSRRTGLTPSQSNGYSLLRKKMKKIIKKLKK